MTIHVIGCGATAKLWNGSGVSIGVNDCWKTGKPTNTLLVINRIALFSPERLDTIISSKPKIFYTNLLEWRKYFPEAKLVHLTKWDGYEVERGQLIHSKTSPFVAMSIAYGMGATNIVLWGVDFVDHKNYSPGKSGYEFERLRYLRLSNKLKDQGVKVYLGAPGSNLKLPIWHNSEKV